MNKLMYRFVATTKKKNRPVFRHGMPLQGIPRKKKNVIDPFLDTVCPLRASRVKKTRPHWIRKCPSLRGDDSLPRSRFLGTRITSSPGGGGNTSPLKTTAWEAREMEAKFRRRGMYSKRCLPAPHVGKENLPIFLPKIFQNRKFQASKIL